MDITKEIFEFCDLRRHLWNAHFSRHIDNLADDNLSAVQEIQKLLFRVIVLSACDRSMQDLSEFGIRPIDFIEVLVSQDVDRLDVLEAPPSHPRTWKKVVLSKSDWSVSRLLFVDFFDWYPQDPLGRCSYSQVEVEVATTADSPSTKRWLLPSEYSSFRFTNK